MIKTYTYNAMVTIKDIAQKLNINFSTVSRALNDKPGVSEKTRKRVLKAAEEMGYQPNGLARGLVSRSTKTLAVIIPDIINPLFGEITTGIIETANTSHYDVFLCITNWNAEMEKQYIQTIRQKQVDGIIIKSVSDANISALDPVKLPVVGIESGATNTRFSSVSTDNIIGGSLVAEHLLKQGYEHTAIISGPATSTASVNRCMGFTQAMANHQRTFSSDRIFTGSYDIASGYTLTEKILSQFPETDSIFACNDVIALGTLQYLEEHGIKVGTDIGVIGFDNIALAGMPQIQLTTVEQPKKAIGRIVVNLLLEEIRNHAEQIKNHPQRVLLNPTLVVRGTTSRE
jgi:LacI family transcriptional regulator